VIDDETVVESSVPGEELVLLAKVRPAAKARITLRLTDLPGGGCRVAMSEVVVSRPLPGCPTVCSLLGVAPRNRECTLRLRRSPNCRSPMPLE